MSAFVAVRDAEMVAEVVVVVVVVPAAAAEVDVGFAPLSRVPHR
jgi:hypothetical protein